jgi:molecular chaperone GrpE
MSIKQQETRPESQDAVPESPTIQTKPSSAEAGQASPSSSPDEADGSGGADGSRLTALEAELAAAREELAAVNDKYLRKLAEDVNFRKRMTREKEDGQRFAVATLLGDLIPVLDDFDRAVASAEVQKDYTVLHDGVLLIRRQLGSVLEAKYGLARIDSLGKPFDPNHHEAVAIVQGGPEDGEEAVVAEEFLPGYGLHDRILRTAKVRVRMPAPKSSAPDAPAGAAEAPVDSN